MIFFRLLLRKKSAVGGVCLHRADAHGFALQQLNRNCCGFAASGAWVLDAVNQEFGRDTLHSAAEGVAKRWAMRAGMRSPRYTTQWDELPVVS